MISGCKRKGESWRLVGPEPLSESLQLQVPVHYLMKGVGVREEKGAGSCWALALSKLEAELVLTLLRGGMHAKR